MSDSIMRCIGVTASKKNDSVSVERAESAGVGSDHGVAGLEGCGCGGCAVGLTVAVLSELLACVIPVIELVNG